MADAEAPAQVTRDAFLGGRLVLQQPARGHRAGTDAVLLAAAAPRGFIGRVIDAGAGVGTVGLAVALASPDAHVTLIERDAASAALAESNIAANGLAARAAVARCDLLSREDRRALLPEPADLVLTNPPFYRADRVRASPQAGRRAAHVLDSETGLADWLLACLSLVAPRGSLILIHKAEALPALLTVLEGRLGAIVLKTVHPRAGEPASRVLVRGTKGSRGPFSISAPLALHNAGGFTAEAARLHTGAVQLDW